MVRLNLLSITEDTIANGYHLTESLVEENHEIVLEVLRHTTTIASGIADDLSFVRQHFDIRPFVEGIYHDVGLICLWEGELHHDSTSCRSHFCDDIIVCQIHPIIIR